MRNNGSGSEKTCGKCGHCGDLKNRDTGQIDARLGVCRRLPPQIVVLTMMSGKVLANNKPPMVQVPQSMYPIVAFRDQACGV